MKGKTLLSLAIVATMLLAAIPFATVKAVDPVTVSVMFDETGTNTLTKASGSDFNVSVMIANVLAPGIDFYSIKIHWDPAVVTLKHNDTTMDVLSGGFTPGFAGPSYAGTHFDTGTLDDVSGYNSVGKNSGSGKLFKMVMHDIKDTSSPFLIVSPNVDTYLMDGVTQINIGITVNGTATFTPPPATPPHAIITWPVDSSSFTVGDTINLDGHLSTDGVDSVPPSEICPITVWNWTVDFNNGTVINLYGSTNSFVCTGPGSVTITLTVTAPDPTPGDSGYVDHDTDGPITIFQVPAASGPNIDVYTARGGLGHLGDFPYPYAWSDAYGPQEEVCVFAKVTYNGAPVEYKPVEFVIMDNNGDERDSRTAFTNASGIATVCFRIPWQGSDAENYFGNWSIYGTVDISQVQVSDTVMFKFGYILFIETITVTPFSLSKGDTMTIDVTIGSIAFADYGAFLQISAHDNCNVPIGQAFATITVPASGFAAVGNTIVIPDWAYVGAGVVYVDLLTSKFGLPYCPEKFAAFLIVYP